jgi:hypothetical protein
MGFLNRLIKFDRFGAPITLTYKGTDTFETIYGAIASIVLGLTLMTVFIF